MRGYECIMTHSEGYVLYVDCSYVVAAVHLISLIATHASLTVAPDEIPGCPKSVGLKR